MTSDLDMAAASATDPSAWMLLLLAATLAVALFVVREVTDQRRGPSVAAVLARLLRPAARWCWRRCSALFVRSAGHAATFWEWLVWGVPWPPPTSRGERRAHSG